MQAPFFSKNLIVAIALLPLLAACDEGGEQAASAGSAPPVAVSVVTVKPEAIPITNELPGRIAPTRIAEVRPRVSGIIEERVFEQGSMVEEGDVLYRIDPAPFRVQVARAEANLQRAEAARLLAQQQAERQRELRRRNIASEQAYDSAVAALAQADADVAAARAVLAAARLDLQYAEVKAPISGRIGRALITEGALVSPDRTESLATIQQLDPIYADFTQSASELIRLRNAHRAGTLTNTESGAATVRLLMDDGTPYPHPGKLLFSEASVDATTGQVTLRGEFPNPESNLLPGMYVRVQIQQGVQRGALAVPKQAVQRDTGGGARLYVVGEDDKAELRPVVTGRALDHRWIIEKGLEAGERVIVEGFQKIQPGAPVSPQAWDMPGTEPDPSPDGPRETARNASAAG